MSELQYSVGEHHMKGILIVCKAAIENANQLLIDHERVYGREPRRNRIIAESYEADIVVAQSVLDYIKERFPDLSP